MSQKKKKSWEKVEFSSKAQKVKGEMLLKWQQEWKHTFPGSLI